MPPYTLTTVKKPYYRIDTVPDTQRLTLYFSRYVTSLQPAEVVTFKGPANVHRLGQGLLKLITLEDENRLSREKFPWDKLIDAKCPIFFSSCSDGASIRIWHRKDSFRSGILPFDKLKEFVKDFFSHAKTIK